MKFDFGKYGPKNFPPDGVNIAFVNSDYLQWLMREDWFIDRDDDLVVAVEKELNYRDEQDCHFAKDKVIPKNTNEKKEVKKEMNEEQFIPTNGAQVPTVLAVQPPADSVEMRANMVLAKVTMDARLTEILQLAAKLRQLQQFKRITDQTQYDQAIDAFNLTRDKIKEGESIRHEHVDLPTMIVKLINQFFKSIKDDLERTKAHLGGIIDKRKREDDEAAKRAQEEAAEKLASGETVVVEKDGVGQVVFDPSETTVPPENVVTSSRGASVQTRTDLGVEVADLKEFLKVCVSANKRNLWLSENLEKVIEIKLAPLKVLIKENKKKTVPGLKLEQTRRTV